MGRLSRWVIIAALLVSFLVGAATASASWSTNGPVNFTSTTGTVRFTLSSGARIVCAPTGLTPNVITGTGASMSGGSGSGLASVTPRFITIAREGSAAACRVFGVPLDITCSASSFSGFFWSAAGGVSPNWYGSTTTGTIVGISCTFSIPNCVTTVTGTVPVTYANPTSSVAGRFTVVSAGQNLHAANSNSATCVALRAGNGDQVAIDDGAGGNVVYTMTSPAIASQLRIWQP